MGRRPERVRAACEKALAELKCTYLDLYLMVCASTSERYSSSTA